MEEVTINILDMLAPSGVMHLLVKRLVSLLQGGLVGSEDKRLQLLLKLTRVLENFRLIRVLKECYTLDLLRILIII